MRVLVTVAASVVALAGTACAEQAAPPRFAPTQLDQRCAAVGGGWSPSAPPPEAIDDVLDDAEEAPAARPRLWQTVVLDGDEGAYLDPYRSAPRTRFVVYEGAGNDGSGYAGGAFGYAPGNGHQYAGAPRGGGRLLRDGSPARGGSLAIASHSAGSSGSAGGHGGSVSSGGHGGSAGGHGGSVSSGGHGGSAGGHGGSVSSGGHGGSAGGHGGSAGGHGGHR